MRCADCSKEFKKKNHRQRFCCRKCKWRYAKKPSSTKSRREAAIKALGACCARCSLNDIRVLEVDHVNNDGARERREKSRSAMMSAISDGTSLGYQVLCRNCNWIKYLELKEING